MERILRISVVVNASLSDVWRSWTSSKGAETFFAPKARILLDIGGEYEILSYSDARPGCRGAEDLKILSYVPEEMLSFEWRAPRSSRRSERRRAGLWCSWMRLAGRRCESRSRISVGKKAAIGMRLTSTSIVRGTWSLLV